MSGDISHQGTDGEERATRRGDDASFQRRNGWSVTGDAGLGGEWADGEPCYAYLDRERWDRVRSQLPRNSPLRIQDGRMVQVSAIGSRLTFWFQYGYHRLKAMNDRPVLRRLVRQELGDDIVVELRETAELLDMEPVA